MNFSSVNTCRVAACAVLAIFYGIYYGKMLLQRRKGIKTNQIGSSRVKGRTVVERLMGCATMGVVAAQLVSIAFGLSALPAGARSTGFVLALLGDALFFVSVWTMRDSWRAGIPAQDKTAFVSRGIYRYSRNPAFLGFDLMYLGVLLLFCNVLLLVFTVFAIVMLHLQILQEERYLAQRFGTQYEDYRAQVMRYLGRK